MSNCFLLWRHEQSPPHYSFISRSCREQHPAFCFQAKQPQLTQLFFIGFIFQTFHQLYSLDLLQQLNILEMRGPELDTSIEVLPHHYLSCWPSPNSYPKTLDPLVTISSPNHFLTSRATPLPLLPFLSLLERSQPSTAEFQPLFPFIWWHRDVS